MRHIASGLFTIGNPTIYTGKMHMVFVRCDLCKKEELFDPEKVHSINVEIERIQKEHLCEKPVPDKKKKKVRKFRKVWEYEKGSRPDRYGPQMEDE